MQNHNRGHRIFRTDGRDQMHQEGIFNETDNSGKLQYSFHTAFNTLDRKINEQAHVFSHTQTNEKQIKERM